MGTKNCPETARQKMINMMYLVLLAMMAMNVAAEVLDAFRVVDASLVQTYGTLEKKSDQQYNAFKAAYDLNPSKVDPWLKKANEVQAKVDSVQKLIFDIKEDLVLRGGGIKTADIDDFEYDPSRSYITNYEGDSIMITKDDELNVPSELMVRLGRGKELRAAMSSLRSDLAGMVGEDAPIHSTIEQELATPDPKRNMKEGGENLSWEEQNFEHKPMIAVITLLSKMQIDVKNTEANLLNYLYSQIDASSFKFNKLSPVVIPKSSYVLEGDTYHAEVFLAAEDTTQQPRVFVGGKELKIVNGKGIYEVPAGKAGDYPWEGEIQFKNPEGEYVPYKFSSTYQVGKPSVTISPTKMNVFYLNIANPISVSVPGVPSANLRVTMSNGRVEERADGRVVFPAKEDINGKNTQVIVDAIIDGQTKRMGSMVFRVKRVPDPVAQIAEKNGGVLRKEDLMAEQGIFAALIDFDFDLKFKVTQFDVTITGSGGFNNTWTSKSNAFTADMKKQFASLQAGSIIYFDNIMAHGDDKTDRNLAPISFKIR
ncbi:type IX secretion system motor protein PorM/GldM [Mangrovibacterium diazotrophicum]|uniref:Gliding motility-associated protein GldM n=1 Tax=Mangrovibacterium diazotrophicum TaxID=1261403 RepID=A0A419W974_9BACT|nr:gliding motility protein GldM [Mangrovibacterium diazotrophicum]RKD91964.1 gliding motility-associated protein GldM [Mangrovibacterium diazotrophicum]